MNVEVLFERKTNKLNKTNSSMFKHLEYFTANSNSNNGVTGAIVIIKF